MPGIGTGIGPMFGRGGAKYDPEAQAYFDLLSPQPSGTFKDAVNAFVVGVKSDEGITSLTQSFAKIHIRGSACGGESNALVNLVQNLYHSVKTESSNTMGWGKAGFININNSYLKESWIPSTDGGSIYGLNNGAVGVYIHGNQQSDGYLYGTYRADINGTLHQAKRLTTNATNIFFNNTGAGSPTAATGNIDGFNFNLRTNSTTILRTRNGSLVQTITANSVAVSDKELYSIAGNANGSAASFSPYQQSFFVVCKGSIGWANFSTRVETLMLALGCSYTQVKKAYFFGDSNTAGTGVTNSLYRWPTLLSLNQGWFEVNNAQSGTTLQRSVPIDYFNPTNMYDRQTEIPTFDSATMTKIFFAYAVNDARALEAGQTNYTAATYGSQLGEIIDGAVAKGWAASDIVCVCCTVVNPSVFTGIGIAGYRAFATAANTVCQTKGATHVDPFDYMVANGNLTLLGDTIHMNDSGHQVLTDYIVSQL